MRNKLKAREAQLEERERDFEAAQSGNKSELKTARQQKADLLQECEAKAKQIQAGLNLQEEMKGKMIWGDQ